MTLAAYDPSRWGRAFGVVDRTVYSPPLYQHRGQDLRLLGAAGTGSVVADVTSLSAGRVSHLYTAAATGREVVVDTGRQVGRYEIHCHSASFPKLGLKVVPGTALTVNATAEQQPGTAWTAPHDHFVISDYPDAAHTPARHVHDPRPFILSALAAVAGGGETPFLEDDMPYTPDDLKSLIYDVLQNDVADPDAPTVKGLAAVVERRVGQALVKTTGNDGRNVLDGIIQARFDIAGLAKTVGVTDAQVQQIITAVKGAVIDYAALAKAVTDDAARRLAQ